MPRENAYQAELIKTIRSILPGCIIQKLDPAYQQGIPDLLILFNDRWGTLEVKKSANEPFQPNQEFFIDQMNEMSFSSVIYPEIEEEVLRGLQQALQPQGRTRIPKRK